MSDRGTVATTERGAETAMTDSKLRVLPQHTDHPRAYHENKYVYPVLSRRSRGISIGINLNPDKICNFDCVYCQVDRRSDAELRFVDTDRLLRELDSTVTLVTSGALFEDPAFASVPEPLRRLNDFAFSGDGEPTTLKNFGDIVDQVATLKRRHGLDRVKLVAITNASMFHRPDVLNTLERLVAAPGEVWAKLDAGTEEYFRLIERTPIPFSRILANLELASKRFPIVIQSLFLRYEGVPPDAEEMNAYIGCLEKILTSGGRIDRVQIYTIARPPAESVVAALSDDEVDQIVNQVRARLPISVEAYYGSGKTKGNTSR
ncbi:MAG: radical SAM protein [Planctomycetota bacterium]